MDLGSENNNYVSQFSSYLGKYADNAEAHYARGIVHTLERQIASAKRAMLQALALKPEWAEAHQSLAVLQFETGDTEEAYERFKRAISLRPTSLRLRLNACQSCYQHAYYPGVIEMGERALQLTGDRQIAVTLLGWIAKSYAAQGDLVAALNAAERATTYVPDDAWLLNNVAVLHLRLGHVTQAIKSLQRANELDPNLEIAQRNLQLANQLAQQAMQRTDQTSVTLESPNDRTG